MACKSSQRSKSINAHSGIEIIVPAKQKTILIAEDEELNYRLLIELFNGLDANIIWAHDGWEALQACKTQQHIDLVLMDMKMPVMDGFKATKLIREFLPDIPIIAQTAYASEKDKIKVLECGCNDIISKPFDIVQFKLLINTQFASLTNQS